MLKQSLIKSLTLSFIFVFISCNSQVIKQAQTGKIYEQDQVDKKAVFEEGKKQLIQFLSSNIEYPKEAIQKNIQGKVLVKFVVEDNGTISNFKILEDIGAGSAKEVIKVLEQKTQSRWNSAKIDKKRVRSYYVLGVTFKIPSDNSKPYIQEDLN